jgi:uracil phosphoribosyltransferase
MVYEVTRDWPTKPRPVQTPMERMTGKVLARQVTLVPILRAGLGMADGVHKLLPEARIGHLGVYRDEKTLEPVSYYQKFPPDIAATEVLLIDPMLATGGSALAAVSFLKKAGVTSMKFVCLVAAPEGVQALHRQHPDVPIYCAAIDRELNQGVHPARPGRRRGSPIRYLTCSWASASIRPTSGPSVCWCCSKACYQWTMPWCWQGRRSIPSSG